MDVVTKSKTYSMDFDFLLKIGTLFLRIKRKHKIRIYNFFSTFLISIVNNGPVDVIFYDFPKIHKANNNYVILWADDFFDSVSYFRVRTRNQEGEATQGTDFRGVPFVKINYFVIRLYVCVCPFHVSVHTIGIGLNFCLSGNKNDDIGSSPTIRGISVRMVCA